MPGAWRGGGIRAEESLMRNHLFGIDASLGGNESRAPVSAAADRLIAAWPRLTLFRFCNMRSGGFFNRLNQLLLRCSQKMHNGGLTK